MRLRPTGVDQLERQKRTHRPLRGLLRYTPVWRPRLLPLVVCLVISLLLWLVIVVIGRWALSLF